MRLCTQILSPSLLLSSCTQNQTNYFFTLILFVFSCQFFFLSIIYNPFYFYKLSFKKFPFFQYPDALKVLHKCVISLIFFFTKNFFDVPFINCYPSLGDKTQLAFTFNTFIHKYVLFLF